MRIIAVLLLVLSKELVMKKALLIMLLVSPVAHAEYFGIGIGQGKAENYAEGAGNDTAAAFSILVGHDFGRIRLEGGFTRLGEFSDSIRYVASDGSTLYLSEDVRVSSLHVAVAPEYSIGNFDLYAKAGIGLWMLNIDAPIDISSGGTTSTYEGRTDDGEFAPIAGLGAKFTVTDAVAIGVGYTRFFDVGKGTVMEYKDLGLSVKATPHDVDLAQLTMMFKY